jgi:hypothetical protein
MPSGPGEAIMKSSASRRLHQRAFVLAAAVGLTLAAATAAKAFTFEDQNGNASGGNNFYEGDASKRPPIGPGGLSNFNNGGSSVTHGNTTFQFGSASQQSFDQKYNPSNLFDPYARDGRE